jgi:hypothetical protein
MSLPGDSINAKFAEKFAIESNRTLCVLCAFAVSLFIYG